MRTFRLKGPREAPPWSPVDDLPACSRCGQQHFKEWMTRVDSAWVADGCLTPEERERWTRTVEERPQGKIHVPVS